MRRMNRKNLNPTRSRKTKIRRHKRQKAVASWKSRLFYSLRYHRRNHFLLSALPQTVGAVAPAHSTLSLDQPAFRGFVCAAVVAIVAEVSVPTQWCSQHCLVNLEEAGYQGQEMAQTGLETQTRDGKSDPKSLSEMQSKR